MHLIDFRLLFGYYKYIAKFKEKILARKLRHRGKSIKTIAKLVNVSKSTVSRWCSDIFLSETQQENLLKNSFLKIKQGSIIASENQKKERVNRLNFYKKIGLNKIGQLSPRELFLIGSALYWAEGDKKQRRVVFVNSDPNMILIFMEWLNICLNIPKERLCCRVEINQIHQKRLYDIQNYWAKLVNIPLTQFRQASFKKSQVNKIYQNNQDYHGSLQITVSKGTNLNYEILGYIDGIAESTKHDKIGH